MATALMSDMADSRLPIADSRLPIAGSWRIGIGGICTACLKRHCRRGLRETAVGSAFQIQDRPGGYDAVRVDAGVAAVVMLLDVVEVDRVRHPRPLVKLARIAPQV